MNTDNRFAPPGANVDDVASVTQETQPVRLWPPSGRIGRLRFLAYSSAAWLLTLLVPQLLVTLLVAGGPGATGSLLMLLISMGGLLVYAVVSVLLLIQRSHDMNVSGWFSLLAFIPLVGLVWIFKGGSAGTNRFGAPPPPNTNFVRIFALVLPAIVVIGIVAAIALPAYQAYVIKARAVQAR